MASITFSFTATAAKITIPGYGLGGGEREFSNTMLNQADPVVRAVAQQWAESATASGTITVTAVP